MANFSAKKAPSLFATANNILDTLEMIATEKAAATNSRELSTQYGDAILKLVQEQAAEFDTPVADIFSEVYRVGKFTEETRGLDIHGDEQRIKIERVNGSAPATLKTYRSKIEAVAKAHDIQAFYPTMTESGKAISAMSQVNTAYKALKADPEKVQLDTAIAAIKKAFKAGKASEQKEILKSIMTLSLAYGE
jgi:hypothetical protein